MSGATTVEKFKKAYRQVQIKDRKKGFKAHLISYMCTNAVLVAVNLLTDPSTLWFLGAVIGWGIGIFAHYFMMVFPAEKQITKMEKEADTLAEVM